MGCRVLVEGREKGLWVEARLWKQAGSTRSVVDWSRRLPVGGVSRGLVAGTGWTSKREVSRCQYVIAVGS